LIAIGIAAFAWPVARAHDAASLAGFLSLGAHPSLAGAANGFANSIDPAHYALIGLALVAIALLRRRLRLALTVPLTMLGASTTTVLLKPLAGRTRNSYLLGPSHQILAASWPSGHATAAMTVALCAVLVAPAALRIPVALLGSIFAVAVGCSILILGWHFPSDVLGGFMVAGLWFSLSLALLWWGERRWPVSHGIAVGGAVRTHALVAPGALVAVGLAVAVGALIEHGRLASTDVQVNAPLIFGALAIASVAALMASGVAVAMRPVKRPRPAPGNGSSSPSIARTKISRRSPTG
jgi:membrane-associated phospholipid phosphatase